MKKKNGFFYQNVFRILFSITFIALILFQRLIRWAQAQIRYRDSKYKYLLETRLQLRGRAQIRKCGVRFWNGSYMAYSTLKVLWFVPLSSVFSIIFISFTSAIQIGRGKNASEFDYDYTFYSSIPDKPLLSHSTPQRVTPLSLSLSHRHTHTKALASYLGVSIYLT